MEGLARSRAHRLLERLKIAVGPPRRVVMFLELGKRLVSKLVLFWPSNREPQLP